MVLEDPTVKKPADATKEVPTTPPPEVKAPVVTAADSKAVSDAAVAGGTAAAHALNDSLVTKATGDNPLAAGIQIGSSKNIDKTNPTDPTDKTPPQISYDKNGNTVETFTNGAKVTLSETGDHLDKKTIQLNGETTEISYDKNSNATNVVKTDKDGGVTKTDTTFDQNNNATSILNTAKDGSVSKTAIAYDANNNPSSITNTDAAGGVTKTDMTYDANKQLTAINRVDSAGNIESLTKGSDGSWTKTDINSTAMAMGMAGMAMDPMLGSMGIDSAVTTKNIQDVKVGPDGSFAFSDGKTQVSQDATGTRTEVPVTPTPAIAPVADSTAPAASTQGVLSSVWNNVSAGVSNAWNSLQDGFSSLFGHAEQALGVTSDTTPPAPLAVATAIAAAPAADSTAYTSALKDIPSTVQNQLLTQHPELAAVMPKSADPAAITDAAVPAPSPAAPQLASSGMLGTPADATVGGAVPTQTSDVLAPVVPAANPGDVSASVLPAAKTGDVLAPVLPAAPADLPPLAASKDVTTPGAVTDASAPPSTPANPASAAAPTAPDFAALDTLRTSKNPADNAVMQAWLDHAPVEKLADYKAWSAKQESAAAAVNEGPISNLNQPTTNKNQWLDDIKDNSVVSNYLAKGTFNPADPTSVHASDAEYAQYKADHLAGNTNPPTYNGQRDFSDIDRMKNSSSPEDQAKYKVWVDNAYSKDPGLKSQYDNWNAKLTARGPEDYSYFNNLSKDGQKTFVDALKTNPDQRQYQDFQNWTAGKPQQPLPDSAKNFGVAEQLSAKSPADYKVFVDAQAKNNDKTGNFTAYADYVTANLSAASSGVGRPEAATASGGTDHLAPLTTTKDGAAALDKQKVNDWLNLADKTVATETAKNNPADVLLHGAPLKVNQADVNGKPAIVFENPQGAKQTWVAGDATKPGQFQLSPSSDNGPKITIGTDAKNNPSITAFEFSKQEANGKVSTVVTDGQGYTQQIARADGSKLDVKWDTLANGTKVVNQVTSSDNSLSIHRVTDPTTGAPSYKVTEQTANGVVTKDAAAVQIGNIKNLGAVGDISIVSKVPSPNADSSAVGSGASRSADGGTTAVRQDVVTPGSGTKVESSVVAGTANKTADNTSSATASGQSADTHPVGNAAVGTSTTNAKSDTAAVGGAGAPAKSDTAAVGTTGSLAKSDTAAVGTTGSVAKSDTASVGAAGTNAKSDTAAVGTTGSVAKSDNASVGAAGTNAKSDTAPVGGTGAAAKSDTAAANKDVTGNPAGPVKDVQPVTTAASTSPSTALLQSEVIKTDGSKNSTVVANQISPDVLAHAKQVMEAKGIPDTVINQRIDNAASYVAAKEGLKQQESSATIIGANPANAGLGAEKGAVGTSTDKGAVGTSAEKGAVGTSAEKGAVSAGSDKGASGGTVSTSGNGDRTAPPPPGGGPVGAPLEKGSTPLGAPPNTEKTPQPVGNGTIAGTQSQTGNPAAGGERSQQPIQQPGNGPVQARDGSALPPITQVTAEQIADKLHQQLLANPTDTQLQMQYARAVTLASKLPVAEGPPPPSPAALRPDGLTGAGGGPGSGGGIGGGADRSPQPTKTETPSPAPGSGAPSQVPDIKSYVAAHAGGAVDGTLAKTLSEYQQALAGKPAADQTGGAGAPTDANGKPHQPSGEVGGSTQSNPAKPAGGADGAPSGPAKPAGGVDGGPSNPARQAGSVDGGPSGPAKPAGGADGGQSNPVRQAGGADGAPSNPARPNPQPGSPEAANSLPRQNSPGSQSQLDGPKPQGSASPSDGLASSQATAQARGADFLAKTDALRNGTATSEAPKNADPKHTEVGSPSPSGPAAPVRNADGTIAAPTGAPATPGGAPAAPGAGSNPTVNREAPAKPGETGSLTSAGPDGKKLAPSANAENTAVANAPSSPAARPAEPAGGNVGGDGKKTAPAASIESTSAPSSAPNQGARTPAPEAPSPGPATGGQLDKKGSGATEASAIGTKTPEPASSGAKAADGTVGGAKATDGTVGGAKAPEPTATGPKAPEGGALGLKAADGTVTGTKTAPDATVTGTKTAPDATVTGTKTAPDATVTVTKTAPDATVIGTKTAPDATVTGTKTAPDATVTGTKAADATSSNSSNPARPADTTLANPSSQGSGDKKAPVTTDSTSTPTPASPTLARTSSDNQAGATKAPEAVHQTTPAQPASTDKTLVTGNAQADAKALQSQGDGSQQARDQARTRLEQMAAGTPPTANTDAAVQRLNNMGNQAAKENSNQTLLNIAGPEVKKGTDLATEALMRRSVDPSAQVSSAMPSRLEGMSQALAQGNVDAKNLGAQQQGQHAVGPGSVSPTSGDSSAAVVSRPQPFPSSSGLNKDSNTETLKVSAIGTGREGSSASGVSGVPGREGVGTSANAGSKETGLPATVGAGGGVRDGAAGAALTGAGAARDGAQLARDSQPGRTDATAGGASAVSGGARSEVGGGARSEVAGGARSEVGAGAKSEAAGKPTEVSGAARSDIQGTKPSEMAGSGRPSDTAGGSKPSDLSGVGRNAEQVGVRPTETAGRSDASSLSRSSDAATRNADGSARSDSRVTFDPNSAAGKNATPDGARVVDNRGLDKGQMATEPGSSKAQPTFQGGNQPTQGGVYIAPTKEQGGGNQRVSDGPVQKEIAQMPGTASPTNLMGQGNVTGPNASQNAANRDPNGLPPSLAGLPNQSTGAVPLQAMNLPGMQIGAQGQNGPTTSGAVNVPPGHTGGGKEPSAGATTGPGVAATSAQISGKEPGGNAPPASLPGSTSSTGKEPTSAGQLPGTNTANSAAAAGGTVSAATGPSGAGVSTAAGGKEPSATAGSASGAASKEPSATAGGANGAASKEPSATAGSGSGATGGTATNGANSGNSMGGLPTAGATTSGGMPTAGVTTSGAMPIATGGGTTSGGIPPAPGGGTTGGGVTNSTTPTTGNTDPAAAQQSSGGALGSLGQTGAHNGPNGSSPPPMSGSSGSQNSGVPGIGLPPSSDPGQGGVGQSSAGQGTAGQAAAGLGAAAQTGAGQTAAGQPGNGGLANGSSTNTNVAGTQTGTSTDPGVGLPPSSSKAVDPAAGGSLPPGTTSTSTSATTSPTPDPTTQTVSVSASLVTNSSNTVTESSGQNSQGTNSVKSTADADTLHVHAGPNAISINDASGQGIKVNANGDISIKNDNTSININHDGSIVARAEGERINIAADGSYTVKNPSDSLTVTKSGDDVTIFSDQKGIRLDGTVYQTTEVAQIRHTANGGLDVTAEVTESRKTLLGLGEKTVSSETIHVVENPGGQIQASMQGAESKQPGYFGGDRSTRVEDGQSTHTAAGTKAGIESIEIRPTSDGNVQAQYNAGTIDNTKSDTTVASSSTVTTTPASAGAETSPTSSSTPTPVTPVSTGTETSPTSSSTAAPVTPVSIGTETSPTSSSTAAPVTPVTQAFEEVTRTGAQQPTAQQGSMPSEFINSPLVNVFNQIENAPANTPANTQAQPSNIVVNDNGPRDVSGITLDTSGNLTAHAGANETVVTNNTFTTDTNYNVQPQIGFEQAPTATSQTNSNAQTLTDGTLNFDPNSSTSQTTYSTTPPVQETTIASSTPVQDSSSAPTPIVQETNNSSSPAPIVDSYGTTNASTPPPSSEQSNALGATVPQPNAPEGQSPTTYAVADAAPQPIPPDAVASTSQQQVDQQGLPQQPQQSVQQQQDQQQLDQQQLDQQRQLDLQRQQEQQQLDQQRQVDQQRQQEQQLLEQQRQQDLQRRDELQQLDQQQKALEQQRQLEQVQLEQQQQAQMQAQMQAQQQALIEQQAQVPAAQSMMPDPYSDPYSVNNPSNSSWDGSSPANTPSAYNVDSGTLSPTSSSDLGIYGDATNTIQPTSGADPTYGADRPIDSPYAVPQSNDANTYVQNDQPPVVQNTPIYDPSTGNAYDPVTRMQINPNTGEVIGPPMTDSQPQQTTDFTPNTYSPVDNQGSVNGSFNGAFNDPYSANQQNSTTQDTNSSVTNSPMLPPGQDPYVGGEQPSSPISNVMDGLLGLQSDPQPPSRDVADGRIEVGYMGSDKQHDDWRVETSEKSRQLEDKFNRDEEERRRRDLELKEQEEKAKRFSDAMLAAMATRRSQEEEAIRAQRQQLQNVLQQETRQKYVVLKGDTLESISLKKLRDRRLAHLVYEINKSLIPIRLEDGKKLLQLRPRMVIYLPTQLEIKRYHSRLFGKQNTKFEYDAKIADSPDTTTRLTNPGLIRSDNAFLPNLRGTTPDMKLAEQGANSSHAQQASDPATQKRRANIESLLGRFGSTVEKDGRIRYVCRLGDTLRSVAMRHPALRDVTLWKLLAEVNALPTNIDQKGVPVAALKRGETIVLPLPQEVTQFRAKHGKPETASTVNTGRTTNLPVGPKTDVQSSSGVQSFEMVSRPCPQCKRLTSLKATICPACAHPFNTHSNDIDNSAMPSSVDDGNTATIPESKKPPRVEDATTSLLLAAGMKPMAEKNLDQRDTLVDERAVRNFITAISDTSRIVSYGNMDGSGVGFRIRLEVKQEEFWLPVIRYEINEDSSVRHAFNLTGNRKTTRLDLPAKAAKEMAEHDLTSNAQKYSEAFLGNQPLSELP